MILANNLVSYDDIVVWIVDKVKTTTSYENINKYHLLHQILSHQQRIHHFQRVLVKDEWLDDDDERKKKNGVVKKNEKRI